MTKNNITEAEAKSTEIERSILVAAKIKNQNAVNKDPSVSNLAALEKTTKMLADYDARMVPDAALSFANRIEALGWLQRQGYKIKKSKLYNDCKSGALKLQSDGSVLENNLKKYAKKAALEKLAMITPADTEDLRGLKNKAELEKLRTQNKLLQHQLDEKQHKYMSREEFEMEFAAKLAVLKSGIEYMVYSYGFEWAKEVLSLGDGPAATQKLITMINQAFIRQFNDFAKLKTFKVKFSMEEKDIADIESDHK